MFAGHTWAIAGVLHIVGGAIGGVGTALGLWLVLTPVRPSLTSAAVAIFVTLLAIALVRDLLWRFPILQRRVQVNPAALAERPFAAAFLYGMTLGTGVLTFIAFASMYAFLVVVGLQHSIGDAVALGAGYGVGRGALPFAISALAPDPRQTEQTVRSMVAWRPVAALLSWTAAAGLAYLTAGQLRAF